MKSRSNKLPKDINDIVFSEMTLWLLRNRPPEEIRAKLDISWRIEGQSVFLFEIRPYEISQVQLIASILPKQLLLKKDAFGKYIG